MDEDQAIAAIGAATGLRWEQAALIAQAQRAAPLADARAAQGRGPDRGWRSLSSPRPICPPGCASSAPPNAPPTPRPFSDCPDHCAVEWYTEAVPVGHPAFGVLQPCCRLLARQAGEQAAQRSQTLATMTDELGLLADRTFASFDLARLLAGAETWGGMTFGPGEQQAMLQRAYDQAQRFAAQPADALLLVGSYGSGKSHLAAAIGNQIRTQGGSVRYRSTPALLRELRQGLDDHSADDRIEALQAVDLLILDDLGSEYGTAWTEDKLFDLINARYLYRRPLVLTSNLPLAQIGGRVGSRIAELALELWLVAADYRRLPR